MKVSIEEGFTETEVIIKCPALTEEIRSWKAYLLSGASTKLSATKDGTVYLVDKAAVLYFESVDRRTFVYTENDVYEVALKLYEVESLLGVTGFVRSSKSQVVNIAQIESLRPNFDGRLELTMKNGEEVIVSRQYAKILKERLRLK